MKKIMVLGLLLTFLVTGCNNNKKVQCAFYEEGDGGKITYDYLITYDKTGEIMKTIKFTTAILFEDSSELNEISGQVDSLCDVYETEDFEDSVKCKAKQKDNSVEVTIELMFEKLSDEQKESFMGTDFEMSYEELKQNYESLGHEQKLCVFDSKEKLEPVLFDGGFLGVLSDTKSSAAEEYAYNILRAAENYLVTYMLENNGNTPGALTFVCDGKKCTTEVDGKTVALEYKGIVPTSGSIYLPEYGDATIKEALVINGYTCTMNDDIVVCEK